VVRDHPRGLVKLLRHCHLSFAIDLEGLLDTPEPLHNFVDITLLEPQQLIQFGVNDAESKFKVGDAFQNSYAVHFLR